MKPIVMNEKMEPSGNDDALKAENDFLKLKMMLEHGAEFGTSKDLPAAIENEFLRSVMEYEKQFEKGERIKVFDKLGQPKHFRPVKEISDADMEKEWISLLEFMQSKSVELSVCSPNVGPRELYRFATEELFDVETDKIDMPGMMTCFIYDEFHPDYVYDNSRIAVDDCINYFFDKAYYSDTYFADKIRVNQHTDLTRAELKYIVQNFKNSYDQIVPVHIESRQCSINGNHCTVKGWYEVAFMVNEKSQVTRGEWTVAFLFDKDSAYWNIKDVQITGIRLP
jgi:hypothetical protein